MPPSFRSACFASAGLALLVAAACSGSPSLLASSSASGGHGGLGGGGRGGGGTAGAPPDAGHAGAGAGGHDAGHPPPPPDGGGHDAGGHDAGPPPRADIPALGCNDTLANVYVTPANLPPMTKTTRGDVIRCAEDLELSPVNVQAEVTAKAITTPMTTGVTLYRIAYRTTRGNGSAGASTARVYLPKTPRALPLPVMLIGHPTDGLATSCTPSEDETSNQDLALPWAGLGFAVIVPDYAGLGNEGVQGYLDNRDQAYSLLDGARALRKLMAPGVFAKEVFAVGFSQGGGAVLSTQALAKSYGSDGELAGVVAFAPEWPTRLNSFGYVDQLNNPTELTIATGISENVVSAMRSYAYFYNYVGPTHAGDGFPAASATGFGSAIMSLCQTPLGGYLQAAAPVVGDLFAPTLETTLLACIDGQGQGAGCVDPGKSYYAFLTENVLTADPSGPPVLYVQGLLDYIMPPASEAACNLVKLAKDGVVPTVCVDPGAQHQDVVARNMDFVLAWSMALLAGAPLPTCAGTGMPACAP